MRRLTDDAATGLEVDGDKEDEVFIFKQVRSTAYAQLV
jgi:hypothetical protein